MAMQDSPDGPAPATASPERERPDNDDLESVRTGGERPTGEAAASPHTERASAGRGQAGHGVSTGRADLTPEERAEFFEREVMQHLDALYRTALRMTRNAQDAEDLVQETSLRAYRFLDRFEPGTNLRAWLFKILTNTYINRYRKASTEPRIDSLDDSEEFSLYHQLDAEAASRGGSVEAQVLDRFAENDIKAAIEALPPQYRMTVLLADVEGFSYSDIAEITGVKKGTVMSRLFRGRRLLQKALVEQARAAGFAGRERRP